MERIDLARLLGVCGTAGAPHAVIIDASQPGQYMEQFGAAVAAGGTVFVADPSWGAVEQAQFAAVITQAPGGKRQAKIADRKSPTADRQSAIANGQSEIGNRKPKIELGWLCLPTGGSSGALRWARHDQDTLAAAVCGCCDHFAVSQVNAVGVLPLYHVSGLMAWLRCALTGGRYVPWDWTDLEAGRWPLLAAGEWFLSLVPTQLQRLLGRPEATDWLRRFRAVFIGGGPAWPELLDRAAEARLPLAPGYGMTETAAMVAALRPEEFLRGRRGCGSALPHAGLTLNEDGNIQITAKSLFRGYYPDWRETADAWSTEDLGRFDEQGGLHVLGRRDAVIISGGKKIEPAEVEAVLRSSGQFVDVAVVAVPDAEWGEMVVACYPDEGKAPDLAGVEQHLAGKLAPHKRPKRYVSVAWPRNAQGKINRHALAALAAAKGSAGL
jgi:O-succinylbenzoic acid--CoA ligase